MPELTLYRLHPERTPVRMICMYCGAEAKHRRQWRAENRRDDRGGGGSGGGVRLTPVPDGNEPVSVTLAVLLLPLLLWDALTSLAGAVGAVRRSNRTAATPPKPLPPLDPPSTLVTVTTCCRHRRFGVRFAWYGLLLAAVLAVAWYFAIRAVRAEMGTEDATAGTALLTLALSFGYVLAGPVIVDRVGPDTATLDRVREAYFRAAGVSPAQSAAAPDSSSPASGVRSKRRKR